MKKLVWLSFAILLLASACTTYSCPTYSLNDSNDSKDAETEQIDKV